MEGSGGDFWGLICRKKEPRVVRVTRGLIELCCVFKKPEVVPRPRLTLISYELLLLLYYFPLFLRSVSFVVTSKRLFFEKFLICFPKNNNSVFRFRSR